MHKSVMICYAPRLHKYVAPIRAQRYDPSMTDAERAAYANLILLGVPHYKGVDLIEPTKFPVDLVMQWEIENETAEDTAL